MYTNKDPTSFLVIVIILHLVESILPNFFFVKLIVFTFCTFGNFIEISLFFMLQSEKKS